MYNIYKYIPTLSPGKLSGRNDVVSNKVNFRTGIRQKKSRISRICVVLKIIWSYCTILYYTVLLYCT